MSLPSSNYDFLDVIDLDSALKSEPNISQERKGKHFIRSGTPGRYISLESISDDELQLITRSLITPVSFQYDLEYPSDDQRFSCRNDLARQRNILCGNERSKQTLPYRSESAAIFDRLNDDDEISVDFAASDLKDFIDPDLLEGVISRPVSRVPKYDILSRDHDRSGRSHEFDLPSPASCVRHNTAKEIYAEGVKNHTHHVSSITDNNDVPYAISKNSKRHSMDAEVLMSLRRDSDTLLQRRESLLRFRKFSEGITSPNSTKSNSKSVNRRPMAPAQLGPPVTRARLLENDTPYIKYDSSIADINSALRSTTVIDEKYLKRVRSVSFPDHSQRQNSFTPNRNSREPSAAHSDDLVAQESAPYHDGSFAKLNSKYNQNRYSYLPKDKCKASIRKDQHSWDNDTSSRFLAGRIKPVEQNSKLHLISKDSQAAQKVDFIKTDDRQTRKSVTESAKTLLANVRQRRTDDRKEAYNQRSSLSHFSRELDTEKSTDTSKRKLTLTKGRTNLISPKSSANYTEPLIDGDKSSGIAKQLQFSGRGETSSSRYSTVQNRRWSSSLPLSSSLHIGQANVSSQNEGTSKSSKTKQTERRYNYVAKKSALDKSKDRYVALLGKPTSSHY